MSEDTLFHVETPPPPPAGEKLSADRRRTIRQTDALARGRHPLGLALGFPLPLHADAAPADDRGAPGLRCGSCRFRQLLLHNDGTYPKCMFSASGAEGPRVSRGAGTDVRAWWPACRDYAPADPADPRGSR